MDTLKKVLSENNRSKETTFDKNKGFLCLGQTASKFLLFVAAILLTLFLLSSFSDAQTVQTFFVPVTEDQIIRWSTQVINTAFPIGNDVNNVISITATFNGTVIYYDQWEDGYEDNITNPAQSTTQIWGDSNITNGAPPGCLASGCDVINAGTVVALRNNPPPYTPNYTIPANPRDQGNQFFDGRDKFASSQQLVVTRAGWAVPQGPVLAGAAEVFDTRKWGTSYQLPVGQNSAAGTVGSMFTYTAVSIMAKDNGTVVQVDSNADSIIDITQTLNQGEVMYVENMFQGSTITSSNSVQVNLMTGQTGSSVAARWFSLIPRTNWSNSYYSPVRTVSGVANSIILYNPGASAITVNIDTQAGPQTLTVPAGTNVIPAGSIARFNLPNVQSGTRFYSAGAEPFYAILTADYNSVSNEWGALLIPEQDLTPSVVVGWAPGSDNVPPTNNYSPVWVTAVGNTTLYIKYDGNTTAATVPPKTGCTPACAPGVTPSGNYFDASIVLTPLQAQRIYDPDFDMTGARIWTEDGTRIAAAWGQDSSVAPGGLPAMDIGTTVLPFPSLTAYKSASIFGDYNGNGGLDPGEVILYTIRVNNSGVVPITNVNLFDVLDADVTYVANTTMVGSTPVPDDTSGTRFPLDGAGYNIVVAPAQLLPGQDIFVTFQVTVNNPFPPGKTQVSNNVTVSSVTGAEIFLNTQTQLVLQGALETTKTSSGGGLVRPGDTVNYTITVTNTSTIPQTGIKLDDPLPPGTTYVANSTVATGPRQNFVYDKFDKLLYSNNDGPQNWSADWVENDALGGGATGGNVQVVNGELRLFNNAGTNQSAARRVNLPSADYAYAQLLFNFRTNPAVVATDAVVVEMSNTGTGGPFTVLETFTGITGTTSGSRAYDVSGYISPNTAVRFRVSSGYGAGKYFYADKVEIRAVGAFTQVLDQFSAVSYNNNNGANIWAGPWTENDASGGGAGGGKVQVTGGTLRLNGPPTVGTEPGVWRAVNLNQHVFGVLKFNVSNSVGLAVTDTAVIEISKDGTNFTTLETFAGSVTAALRSYDITNYISAATTVRFRITGGYAAAGQYFYADNVEIKAGRQLSVTKDNIPAGVNPDLIDGVPANLVLPADGFALAPNEALTVTYRVTVNNPPSVTRVINTVNVTDHEKAPTSTATVIDNVSNGGTIGDLLWLDTVANGVYDAGEPGLYNVRVWLDTNGNGTYDLGVDRETRTGTNGKYIFEGLPPGTYRVYVDNTTIPAGLTLTAGTNPSSPIVITAEEIVLTTDFGYSGNPAAAIIGNYIWSDADNDGMQDSGEAGLGGVTVELRTSPGGALVATATTNAFGTYLFTNVVPGTYYLTIPIPPPGYTITVGPQSVGNTTSPPFTVTAGNSYLMYDFGFYNASTYSVSNRIWFDTNRNGVLDAGEPGIKDVTVTLLDGSGNVVAAAISDINGSFAFSGVPNGNYTVRIEDANGKLIGFAGTTAAAISKSLAVTVSGGNISGASFGYFASGKVGDLIWRDSNGNGIQDGAEAGIAGVQVDLYKDTNGNGLLDTATDQFIGTTSTDVDGRFMFQTSGGGRFFASVASAQAPLTGLVLTTTDDQPAAGYQRTVHLLTVFESNLTADFGFSTPGQIGHAVWNDLNGNGIKESGEPGISGVNVVLYRDANGNGTLEPGIDTLVSTVTTDATGSYVFQASATGTYFVSVDDTQTPVVLMTRTTADDQVAAGVQRTVNVASLSISYLNNNFGFITLASDLSVTKTANPPGDVYPGNVITYTITITNSSATTTQTGITVSDPLPANTSFVPGSTTATGWAYMTTSSTLIASKDTYLQQANPTRNYGATDPLSLRTNVGGQRIPLVEFNLSALPAGATVNSSNMQYYVSTANANITVNLYRLTQNWNEGTASNANCGPGNGNGATWDTYNCVNNWATPGGDYDGTTLLGSFVPSPVGGYQTVASANLNSLVQNWMNGSVANNGVILVPTAASNQTAAIRSRDTVNQEPRLTINYTYVGAQVVTTGTPPNLVSPADNFILPPGQSMTVTYQVTVGSTPDITEIRNVATASSIQTNPRKAFVVNPMKYTSDLRVQKVIQSYSSPCTLGSCTVSYLITVTNIGTVAESNITVNDVLPPQLSFASATPSQGAYNSGTGNWTFAGPLAPGNSATLTLVANVLTRDVNIQNCATLTAATPADQNAANNSSCASFVPTQAVISDFRSYEEKGRTVVEWSTSSETGTAGFYLFRLDEASGKFHQLNRRLLPSLLTSQQGGTYRLIDKGASIEKNNIYILMEVEGNGTKSYHGPYIVHVNGYKARGIINSQISGITTFFLAATEEKSLHVSPKSPRSSVNRHADQNGTLFVTIGNKGKRGQSGRGSDTEQDVESFTRRSHVLPAEKIARLEAKKALKKAAGKDSKSSGTMAKIAVTKEGLYYLSSAEIAQLFSTTDKEAKHLIQSRKLALSNKGNSVAYLPDSSDSGIYFYGEGIDSIYTNENIYWFAMDKGVSIEVLKGLEYSPVLPGTFSEKTHAEKDLFAVTALFKDPEADFWLWDYIVAGDPALGSKTFSVRTDGVADVSSMATLVVNLHGFTNTDAALDHHVRININGTFAGEGSWKGSEPWRIAIDFDQRLLFNGDNTVTVTGLLDTGAPYSIFYVDSFDLAYQRVYTAVADSLIFNAEGNQSITVNGFSSPDIMVFDISEPSAPGFVSGTSISTDGATYSVSFSTCFTGISRTSAPKGRPSPCLPRTRFLAVTSDAASEVSKAWTVTRSDLLSGRNSADYIIITPRELLEPANKLAQYRVSQGMKAVVVEADDVMNEFNYGISSPKAIRDFLSYAYRNWRKQPRYVLLAGKGTFDYKNNQGHGDNLIPPLHTATPWGLNPSDNLLGDIDGDHLPEIAIGRISVLTPEEFHDVISKIITHEKSGVKRVLLLADRPDSGGDFHAESDAVAALVTKGYPLDKLYLSDQTTASARQTLLDRINSGLTLLNYVGHAGIDRLSKTGIFRTSDIAYLSNRTEFPVIAAMTCTAGQFSVPGYDSLSESLVLKKDAGASAVWAPSGMSLSYLAHTLDEGFFKAAFSMKIPIVGDIILEAFRYYSLQGGPSYMLDIYNLQGDPAMRMW